MAMALGDVAVPDLRDWVFDALWELSDRCIEAELPAVADKLEEAMDVYLSECRQGTAETPLFLSQRGQAGGAVGSAGTGTDPGAGAAEGTALRPLPPLPEPVALFSTARPGRHARLRRFLQAREMAQPLRKGA